MEAMSAWVVSANMGLGHNRAAYPFRSMASNGIYLMGEEASLPPGEKTVWNVLRRTYEIFSRAYDIPLAGPAIFGLLDRLQQIPPYYPLKDLSAETFQVKFLYALIRRGLGKSLAEHLSTRQLPVLTTFYASAIAACELTDLPVYCVICDVDINRAWVPRNPGKSRIVYLVPCRRSVGRLMQYGVPADKIILTGFPLPDENIGGIDMPILKNDLWMRLLRLDPSGSFISAHRKELNFYLGPVPPVPSEPGPVTLTYAIGGAGAQKNTADKILRGIRDRVKDGRLKINLVAGVRENVYEYLRDIVRKYGLSGSDGVRIVYSQGLNGYFREFSEILRTTDILWSKPSELSFYCGLGLPFIISPPIGAHEKENRRWLLEIGAGIPQPDPSYLGQWLSDYLSSGRLAQYAWNGFLNAEQTGFYRIKDIVLNKVESPARTGTEVLL